MRRIVFARVRREQLDAPDRHGRRTFQREPPQGAPFGAVVDSPSALRWRPIQPMFLGAVCANPRMTQAKVQRRRKCATSNAASLGERLPNGATAAHGHARGAAAIHLGRAEEHHPS